jgi:hypothetical protein
MRIPLVQSFRIKHAILFAFVLFIAQQLEHTNLLYSGLCSLYILLACLAFNAAGGFIYPSGSWIFVTATLVVIVGITYKAILGEVGESNLRDPNGTMLMECGGILVAGLAAALVRKFTPTRGLLAGMAYGEPMKKAAIGAFVLGAGIQLMSFGIQENGTFFAAIRQINHFTEMAIMLATFYQVKKTGGEQSSNWIVWAAGLWSFVFYGILGFSKQGLLLAAVSWLIAAIVAGHNFSRKQILGICLWAVLFQTYLVPYSQVGRLSMPESPSLAQNITSAWRVLTDVQGTLETYRTDQRNDYAADSASPHLFDTRQGFFDRLNMLSPDDALTNYTDQGNEEGLLPSYEAFFNIIPHFIWKDKPLYYVGNQYAREIGMIAEDNETTGISFSPAADAYHQARWYGIFLVLPVFLLINFFVTNTLSGDVRMAPWGVLFIIISSHDAPEGELTSQLYDATYAAFGVVVIALLSKYVLPIISGIITNSDRTQVRKTVDFKPSLRPRPVDPASMGRPDPEIP